MSIRTLIEINHDAGYRIDDQPSEFAAALGRYLRSGDSRTAEELERFGVRVIGQRHHSSDYRIDPQTDGFAAIHKDARA